MRLCMFVICLALIQAAPLAALSVCETLRGSSAYANCINDQLSALNKKLTASGQQRQLGDLDQQGLQRGLSAPYVAPPTYTLMPEWPMPAPTKPGYIASQDAALGRAQQSTAYRTQSLSNRMRNTVSGGAGRYRPGY